MASGGIGGVMLRTSRTFRPLRRSGLAQGLLHKRRMYPLLAMLLGVGAAMFFLKLFRRGSRRKFDGGEVSEEWRREMRRQRD